MHSMPGNSVRCQLCWLQEPVLGQALLSTRSHRLLPHCTQKAVFEQRGWVAHNRLDPCLPDLSSFLARQRHLCGPSMSVAKLCSNGFRAEWTTQRGFQVMHQRRQAHCKSLLPLPSAQTLVASGIRPVDTVSNPFVLA